MMLRSRAVPFEIAKFILKGSRNVSKTRFSNTGLHTPLVRALATEDCVSCIQARLSTLRNRIDAGRAQQPFLHALVVDIGQ